MGTTLKHLDCTLRDGGYYNDWDFSPELVSDYLQAMEALDVDVVEIGFRFVENDGFKGGYAFSTDDFIQSLPIPVALKDKIGVMVNGSDLLPKDKSQDTLTFQQEVLNKLFQDKDDSPVSFVRIACHVHEFVHCLPAATWLKNKGYLVGFNLMQIANYTETEITQLAEQANQDSITALYFADSMGSLDQEQTKQIVLAINQGWAGEMGIHTHDNMGLAVANTLHAVKHGVTWVDSTVTGMGRGPGNAQTEYLTLALSEHKLKANPTKLFRLIRKHFKPLQAQYGWGTNPYYYLAGKYSIHPTFVQKMLADSCYNDEDIIAVINHLKIEGGKKFNLNSLDAALNFYTGASKGSWDPADLIQGRDVLILGAGPGVATYKKAIEAYILHNRPFVMALNTQSAIAQELIDVRVACHPVRLLADCREHLNLPQPLITPASMLPANVKQELAGKELFDFGIEIKPESFELHNHYCTLPNSLVAAYALAISASGQAKRILLAGFDGYPAGDPRNKEVEQLFKHYLQIPNTSSLISIAPTRYEIATQSIFAI